MKFRLNYKNPEKMQIVEKEFIIEISCERSCEKIMLNQTKNAKEPEMKSQPKKRIEMKTKFIVILILIEIIIFIFQQIFENIQL